MKYIKLSSVIESAKCRRCGDNEYPVLSITKDDGIVLQSEKFKKRIASQDTAQYKVVCRGQLVQGIHIDEANFGIQDIVDEGIVSPAYKIWDVDTTVMIGQFLAEVLRSPRSIQYYSSNFNGSVKRRERLSDKDFLAMEIPCPSLQEQHHILDIIEKARAVISDRQCELQKLDELVKARFVEMFGDKLKYKVEPLNDNVEEMFIGPFGSALKNEYFVDEDDSFCMVYEQKHAIQKTMDLPTRYVDEKKYNELKRFTVLGGDIIVSCRGTIGEIYSIPEDAPMGIMHPSIMKIRLRKEKYCNLFFVLMLEQYMQDSISKAKGSGVKMAVTATELGKELFVVPDIEEQIAFEAFVKQVDKSKVTKVL